MMRANVIKKKKSRGGHSKYRAKKQISEIEGKEGNDGSQLTGTGNHYRQQELKNSHLLAFSLKRSKNVWAQSKLPSIQIKPDLPSLWSETNVIPHTG